MIRLQYVSSTGEILDLITRDGLVRVGDANFHKWKYEFDTTELQYGVKLDKIRRDSIEYEATLVFMNTDQFTKQRISRYQDIFEYDIRIGKTGKLVFGKWSIDCFVSESKMEVSEDIQGVTKEVVFFCPYPFWTKSAETTIPAEPSTIQDGFDFPFDFPFDLSTGPIGEKEWEPGIVLPSDFELTMFGSATNPVVYVNDHPYKVNVSLSNGDRVVINSKENTVIKTTRNGVITNVYNSRQFNPSVFEKIPSGVLKLTWDGSFMFSIKLFEERSEPKW